MTSKVIQISAGEDTRPPIVVNDQYAQMGREIELKFKNNLIDKTGEGKPTAKIMFYDIADYGGNPYHDFCGEGTGEIFQVEPFEEGGGLTACNATPSGEFAYIVRAKGYSALDPVLIIEKPSISESQHPLNEPSLDLITPAITLLIGLLIGYLFARK